MIVHTYVMHATVKLGDKEQIGVEEPFPVTISIIYFIMIRNIWH